MGKKYQVLITTVSFMLFSFLLNAQKSPVACNGQLKIEGAHLKNERAEIIQLRGMSLFWSQWEPEFYVEKTVSTLKNNWKCNVVRAALAVEYDGYLVYPQREQAKIETIIEAAIKHGIYVIVDWHDHHAEDHLEESKAFFTKISKKYGHYPNVIYEVYNEPLNVSWDKVLKPYHSEIIKTIRANDPDNIIVCGTPNWSQRVDFVIDNPIDKKNIAYTLHFYADSHRQELRDIAVKVIKASVPIFVTEYGCTDASGGGIVNKEQTEIWWDLLDHNKISYCNWSVSDKDEACSVLSPYSKVDDLPDDHKLTVAGKLIKKKLIASYLQCED